MAKKKTASSSKAKPSSTKKKTTAAAAKTSKKTSSKASTKKTTKKATASKTSKKTAKSTKKTTTKKATTKKSTTKKAAAKKTSSKKATTKKAPAKAAPEKAETPAKGGKTEAASGRKGITVVNKKPMRRSRPQPKREMPDLGGGLLSSGAKKLKPLIPSGPNAPKSEFSSLPGADAAAGNGAKKRKSTLKAADLKEFKQILLEKRRELVGDMSDLERGALSTSDTDRGASDVAEQGSDAADQTLSLGLADFDRKLIREIDDALQRIEEGTYGICEMTGDAIKVTRLRELPWTRYSIEGARLAERGGRR